MEKVKNKKKISKKTVVFILVTLAPAVLHLLIFWAGVQIQTFVMAFTDQRTGQFTLYGNFVTVIKSLLSSDGVFPLAEAFRNTFIFFAVQLIMMPLTIFAAYMLYKKMAGSAVLRVILYLPGAVSSIMMALVYQQLMMSDGPIMYFLNDILHLGLNVPFITESPLALIITYDVWIGLGGGLIIWLGAMSRIPTDVLEYGRLDGIGTVREFINIVVPLIWPTFVTMMTLALIGIFNSTGSVLIFTEGQYGTYTINYLFYDIVYKGETTEFNFSAALGLILTVATIPIVVGGRAFMNKFGSAEEY